MLLTVNYELYRIPKPGQPKQPARIAEKQPEIPCRHVLRATPADCHKFPEFLFHLRRITDIECVATLGGVRSTYRTMQASCIPRCLHCAIFRPAVLPLGTLTGTTGAIIWRAVFHVACIRPAPQATASFRALRAVWTVLYPPLVAGQLAVAGALSVTSIYILPRALTPFQAKLLA